MTSALRANHLAGQWQPALRGASFQVVGEAANGAWPQSGTEDVQLAWSAAREGTRAWRALASERRRELLRDMARALEQDALAAELLGARFGLEREECAHASAGLVAALEGLGARRVDGSSSVAWVAPDWRELLRGAFLDVARELGSERAVVLVSDARLPGLAERIALAGAAAGLPVGALGLLHGATRELVAQALARAREERGTLVVSALAERVVEWRRLCETHGVLEPRLTALRAGAYEVQPGRDLAESVGEVLERAFARATTFGGQLNGSLARVHCPARLFSRFSELFLAALEASACVRRPVPLIDAEAEARVRSAWELGLDEGATLVAGGEEAAGSTARILSPSVFTNVEPGMATAQRQDPLPVLCLLRGA